METQTLACKESQDTDHSDDARVASASGLFNEYGPMIHSTISHYVNQESDVDDIYQDFFLSLVHRPVPEGISGLRSYLRRAARNDVLDANRKRTSEKTRNAHYNQLQFSRWRGQNPIDTVARSEAAENMLELINTQLFPHEARAVINRYYYGMSTDEAAQDMGINKRSLARYLCMGLKKIRHYLDSNPEVADLYRSAAA